MPNARELQITPVPQPVVVPVQDRVAKDIADVISGVAGAAQLGLGVATADLARKNEDLSTLIKFNGATDQARKSLGLTVTRAQIEGSQNALAAANTINIWFEKLKQQERIGLISVAAGRTPDELQNLIKHNPGIVDPDNLLDFRRDVAKQLAQSDAPTIFSNIARDQNRLGNDPTVVQKTVTQHLDDMVGSRTFPDQDSRQSYLETLLPLVYNTQEKLMLQSWDIQRGNAADSEIKGLQFGFANSVAGSSANFADMKAKLAEAAAKYKTLVPEASDDEIMHKALSSMEQVLVGDTRMVNPLKAGEAIDALISQAGKEKDPRILQFLQQSKAKNLQETLAFQGGNAQSLSALAKTADQRDKISAVLGQGMTFLRAGYINAAGFDALANDARASLRIIQTNEIGEIKNRIDTASSREELGAIKNSFNAGDYNSEQKADVRNYIQKAEQTTLGSRLEFDERQKGNANVILGEPHYKFIDQQFQSLIEDKSISAPAGQTVTAPGVRLSDAYAKVLQSNGIISDTMVSRLNSMPDADAVDTIIAMNRVNADYVKNLIGDADPTDKLKLSPRAYVAASMVTKLGYSTNDVQKLLSGTTNDLFDAGWKSFNSPVPADDNNAPAKVKDAFDSWMPFDRPSEVSKELLQVYKAAGSADYAISGSGKLMGSDPKALLDNAKDKAQATVKDMGSTFEIDGSKYAVLNKGEFAISGAAVDQGQSWREFGDIVTVARRLAVMDNKLERDSYPDINSVRFDKNTKTISVDFFSNKSRSTTPFGTISFNLDDMSKLTRGVQMIGYNLDQSTIMGSGSAEEAARAEAEYTNAFKAFRATFSRPQGATK